MFDPSLQHRQLLPSLLGTDPLTLSIPPVSPIIPLPSLTLLPTPTSTTSATLSSTSTVSTSTSPTPTTPPATAVPSTTSAVDVTTSGGRTTIVVVDPTSSPSPVMVKSFLENKTVQGVVFAVVGIVVLVLIIVIATFVLRRRRRRHLTDEAISFDPGVINAECSPMEKGSIRSSGSDRSYHDHRPHYLPYPRP